MSGFSPAGSRPVVSSRPRTDGRDLTSVQRNRLTTAAIRPLLVPLWYGAERRGAERAPALLDATLRDRWAARRLDDLSARLLPPRTVPVPDLAGADALVDRGDLAFLPAIGETVAALAEATEDALAEGRLALVLGGDHALGGSVAGAVRHVRGAAGAGDGSGRLGVLWIDTHPDLNTPETSLSGHVHGMPLAAMLGHGPAALAGLTGGLPGLRPEDVCLLGVRDIDPGERAMIRELGIWALTMEEWDEIGIDAGTEAALAHLEARAVDGVHVSFDLDVLDPTVLPATGTTAPGGLTAREAGRVLRALRTWSGPIRSLDVVELNPDLDADGASLHLATILLGMALGETSR